MRTKTDIESIKRLTKMLVCYPIEVDKEFPMIVHHPIFRETFQAVKADNEVGLETIDIRDPEGFKRVSNECMNAIDHCTKVFELLLIINKAYSGVYFKLIEEYLDIDDYTETLEHVWTAMEYPNADINVTKREWISYWKKANLTKIYSHDDLKLLYNLPEEFYVYRGLMKGAKVNALSWTLRLDKAKWFANRFNNNGKVYKALCKKKDILAYLSGRNEEEIVVDYKKLKNIEEVL